MYEWLIWTDRCSYEVSTLAYFVITVVGIDLVVIISIQRMI